MFEEREPLPADVQETVAAIHAQLAALVELARDHDCGITREMCPGVEVYDYVCSLPERRQRALLAFAIGALADERTAPGATYRFQRVRQATLN